MPKLQIKVCGPRGSGKTTLLSHIKRILEDFGVECSSEICENLGTEQISVRLSQNDLAHLQKEKPLATS